MYNIKVGNRLVHVYNEDFENLGVREFKSWNDVLEYLSHVEERYQDMNWTILYIGKRSA